MAVDRNLVSGNMGMLILKLLSEKDMYGYEMIDTLKKRSQNVFELKAGTLYPLLHSLEADSYVTVYDQMILGKNRRYYSITNAGKKKIDEKINGWQENKDAVSSVLSYE